MASREARSRPCLGVIAVQTFLCQIQQPTAVTYSENRLPLRTVVVLMMLSATLLLLTLMIDFSWPLVLHCYDQRVTVMMILGVSYG